MEIEFERLTLLATVKSMVIELSQRLGEINPWAELVFDDRSVEDLRAVKRILHEILYAPPPRV